MEPKTQRPETTTMAIDRSLHREIKVDKANLEKVMQTDLEMSDYIALLFIKAHVLDNKRIPSTKCECLKRVEKLYKLHTSTR